MPMVRAKTHKNKKQANNARLLMTVPGLYDNVMASMTTSAMLRQKHTGQPGQFMTS